MGAMLYMVIETYSAGPEPVYQRAADEGRMLPEGLDYVDSWVEADDLGRCFQLMRTSDERLFETWIANWSDIVDFEIVEVLSTSEASTRSSPSNR